MANVCERTQRLVRNGVTPASLLWSEADETDVRKSESARRTQSPPGRLSSLPND